MFPRWRLAPAPDPHAAQSLAAALSVPVPLAALLLQRGVADADAARAFLRPSLDALTDPFRLAGMREAVTIIVAAVRARTPILVHGDYDVDGQCATALLTRALRVAGADVHPFVPHRMTDGYDFGEAGLQEAERVNAGLIITCDCGVTAVAAVARAKAAGRQVIVTDHHLPGNELPPADVVIDPQRADDNSGLGVLCGTGLAFKLVQALVDDGSLELPKALAHHFLDYVALATVADVVPLIGENRIMVRHGLKLLGNSRWPGLRALLAVTRLDGDDLRAGQVGFILAPRLNAVGRLDDAKLGLRMLLADDPVEAAALATQLDEFNVQRQAIDQLILEEVLAQIAGDPAGSERHAAIVLAGDSWHPGVVGIVASRVVERFGRPTFVIGMEGEFGRGSGRSIERFDLHAALTTCGDLLERYGGHRMAAGLTIRRDRVDAFRLRLQEFASKHLTPEDLGPTQRVDLELKLGEANAELEMWNRRLEPCGMGNPSPVYGVRSVELRDARIVGAGHLKARLVAGGAALDSIAFGWGDRLPALSSGPVDVAFKLEQNEFNGRSTLQARVSALAPSVPG